jgi:hypothetical protein
VAAAGVAGCTKASPKAPRGAQRPGVNAPNGGGNGGDGPSDTTERPPEGNPEDEELLEDGTDGEADGGGTGGDEAPATSNGRGGKTGYSEVRFTAGNGLTSSYKIDVPDDAGAAKAYGLHIHLHGDGGGGYQDFPNRATRDGLIGVAVKAPNQGLTWGRQQGVEHGEYLHDLIQSELLKKYNIRLDRIYFSGVSGGSYFLAGNFIPTYGHEYGSGAFLMCGGEAPRVDFVKPEFLRSFRIIWQVTAGERQDITANVRQSIDAYRRALDDVAAGDAAASKMQTNEFEGAGGHCEFDGQSYTTGIRYMLDAKFETVLKD